MAEEYGKIRKSLMVGIADAIRAKKDTTAIFTPEQMVVEIEGIVTGDDLPNAEDAAFGTSGDYERMIEWTEGTGCNQWNAGTIGWEFTANETFGVYGFRGITTATGSYIFKIWDKSDGSIVKQLTVNFTETYKWCEFLLDNAVNLFEGKTYAFTLYGSAMPFRGTLTSYAMNSKVTETGKLNVSGIDAYPTNSITGLPAINMLMGEAITESVINAYKIQADTMSLIADEVIRITGATTKMTTAQIITALQGIATPSTE